MRRSLRWRLQHALHNCVAHPMLVIADVALHTRMHRLALAIQKFHDVTAPDEDAYNVRTFHG